MKVSSILCRRRTFGILTAAFGGLATPPKLYYRIKESVIIKDQVTYEDTYTFRGQEEKKNV